MSNSFNYLEDEIARLKLMLFLWREMQVPGTGISHDSTFAEKHSSIIREIDEIAAALDEKWREDGARHGTLPGIPDSLGLEPWERDAFLLRLAIDEHAGFHRWCASSPGMNAKDSTRVSFLEEVLATRWNSAARECFLPGAPLFRSGLLEYSGEDYGTSRMSRVVHVNPFATAFLLRQPPPAFSRLRPPGFDCRELFSDREEADAIIASFQAKLENRDSAMLRIVGPEGCGKRRLAGFIASRLNRPLLELDLRRLILRDEPGAIIRRAIQGASLTEHIVLMTHAHLLNEEKYRGDRLTLNAALNNETRALVFMTSESAAGVGEGLATIRKQAPNERYRAQIWAEILPDYNVAPELQAVEPARMFNLPGKAIRRAVSRLGSLNALIDGNPPISRHDLIAACREETSSRIKDLAALVEPRFSWDDLVMKPRSKSLLKEVHDGITARRIVFDEWESHGVTTADQGFSILFTGPPGTGKTMSASIIARELSLELYKLDLARVVSKYVGETEKNLSLVFDEAEKANAVLFFDEADSLFGKRGDIKGAQDHYVNQQVSFLLQKMESFRGIAFLATNMTDNMDPAFERRFKHIVRFRKPDVEERSEIWKRAFSEKTPRDPEIDFAMLGKEFNATGAQIKNIAQNACLLAAADSTRTKKMVVREHILHAALREFDKEVVVWEMEYSGPFKEELTRIRQSLERQ